MSGKARFKIGDHVRFSYGMRKVTGTVKEDRGPIGIKGRNLYLIAFSAETGSPYTSQIELPAEDLERVEESVVADKAVPG
jgi:hypothetical protein